MRDPPARTAARDKLQLDTEIPGAPPNRRRGERLLPEPTNRKPLSRSVGDGGAQACPHPSLPRKRGRVREGVAGEGYDRRALPIRFC